MTRSHARQLDQFYTDAPLARELTARLVEALEAAGADPSALAFLEPSAGEGVFLEALAARLPRVAVSALDLDPKHPAVKKADFFATTPPAGAVVFGNPPFGRNATLAVRFFNHAAEQAAFIAFIVPRTFEKDSLQNRLDARFGLLAQHAVAADSFHFQGERVAVPCVFQVWRRLPEGHHRPRVDQPATHPDFQFLKRREGAHFAFQRVGAAAGKIKELSAPNTSDPSHYFLAARPGLDPDVLRARLSGIDWAPIKHRTAGNPSISKRELVAAYAQCVAPPADKPAG